MTESIISEKNTNSATNKPGWERQILEKIALEGIKEQRRARRWGIFFKILFVLYLTLIVFGIFSQSERTPATDQFGNAVTNAQSDHVALLRIHGTIATDTDANAEQLSATIRRAIAKPTVKGIVIDANSGGGSPVQSSIVYQAIQAAKQDYPDKPILTVVNDVCASGCYYIASASDEIYADASSIVGSIGVIAQSFGYGETLKKLGLDPRTFTAGENKDFMDPSRPIKPEEIDFLKGLLDELHQQFIDAVKLGRGERLQQDETIFSGLFWTGQQAQTLGLIDGIATPNEVAQKIGNYPVYDYMRKSPFEKVLEDFGVEATGIVEKSMDNIVNPTQRLHFR
ncbi:signal peptide peptidase SppA [Ostreibacterium oceani]|uniref:Signal peptide peptidase SppA n=1 Tax=Ostreibacterium oceani TaxID=2654998 RepID=A0A6N7EVK0_9GAMM|nr:signal peptide peptidase SppA [Ostreibacterium oceani]MPV86502.1 signal peptide peptidase SppA [Ostreibacterium oceani]